MSGVVASLTLVERIFLRLTCAIPPQLSGSQHTTPSARPPKPVRDSPGRVGRIGRRRRWLLLQYWRLLALLVWLLAISFAAQATDRNAPPITWLRHSTSRRTKSPPIQAADEEAVRPCAETSDRSIPTTAPRRTPMGQTEYLQGPRPAPEKPDRHRQLELRVDQLEEELTRLRRQVRRLGRGLSRRTRP